LYETEHLVLRLPWIENENPVSFQKRSGVFCFRYEGSNFHVPPVHRYAKRNFGKEQLKMTELVLIERIAGKIYLIRGTKTMLDRDLAELYGVETKRLKEQVRRNIERFPEDFMFELTKEELINWRSQFATSNQDIMGLRISPFAFTEHGILMLSSVLKSERAVQVNIQIMRTFMGLRKALLDNKDLRRELEEFKQVAEERFGIIFEALDKLLQIENKPKKKIGYTVKEKQARYDKKQKRKKK